MVEAWLINVVIIYVTIQNVVATAKYSSLEYQNMFVWYARDNNYPILCYSIWQRRTVFETMPYTIFV